MINLSGANKVIEPDLDGNTYKYFDHDTAWLNKVYYSKMPDSLTEMFLQYVQEHRNDPNRPTANHKLAGQINNEFFVPINSNIEMRDEFSPAIQQHFSNIANEEVVDLTVMNVWVNIMKPTEYNPVHTHGGDWSFVWYLDVPEQIRNEWYQSPQERNNYSIGLIEFFPVAQNAGESITFNPKKSDLFIFRANRPHTVYPYYSNKERISISGNFQNVKTISGRTL